MNNDIVHKQIILSVLGKTAGKAAIGTICSKSYSAGINRDSHENPALVVNVLAHEIAHTLGIRHDDRAGTNKTCKCGNSSGCIMMSELDEEVKGFSNCSIQSFHRFLDERWVKMFLGLELGGSLD